VLTIRRAAATLGIAVAAAGLVACGADQVGAAAVVGDERITVSDLQDEVLAFHDFAGTEPVGDQTDLQRGYLQAEIRHRIVEQVGADVGVSVSESDIDQYIADQFLAQNPEGDLSQLMVDNMLTEQGFRIAIHDTIMIDALATELGDETVMGEMFDAAAESMEIEVNPRYGTWAGVGLDPVSGSISVPAGS
jgi:hypothetical protein